MAAYHDTACNQLPHTHSRSFLCLLQPLRYHIYYEAGLFSGERLDLNRPTEPGPQVLPAIVPSSPTIVSNPTYSLLLTCRAVHAEISPLLYSENYFFIEYGDSCNLQALRNLGSDSLSSLTHLTVQLNGTICHWDYPCCGLNDFSRKKNHPCCRVDERSSGRRHHGEDLATSSGTSQATLLEWESTASYLSAHMTPSHLRLYFICDVRDLETGMRAVEPFLSMPTLADCSIRLSRNIDPALQRLAQKTAVRAMGSCPYEPQSPLQFLDLPRELRFNILEYTDLVTPLCEVEWNPHDGFYVHYWRSHCENPWLEDCDDSVHYACQFRNCWQYEDSQLCLCSRRHAACTSECGCWSPPTSLFLVCRTLQEDAQAIFFQKNRFVVTPFSKIPIPGESTLDRLEVSIFLTTVVPLKALGFLKFLEIVFPSFDEDYFHHPERANKDWLRTTDYIRDKLYLPTLTLRVYTADYDPSRAELIPFRKNMTQEQCSTVWKMYVRTLGPLSKLGEMNRFIVHIAWPLYWTPREQQHLRRTLGRISEYARRADRRIEKIVMGESYDSTLLKNSGEGRSQWLEASVTYGTAL